MREEFRDKVESEKTRERSTNRGWQGRRENVTLPRPIWDKIFSYSAFEEDTAMMDLLLEGAVRVIEDRESDPEYMAIKPWLEWFSAETRE